MENYIHLALEDQFKSECKVIDLRYEYPGYTEDIRWAIISDLTEAEITSKYSKQIQEYIPFILLTSEYEVARRCYIRNENKHYMRAVRNGHAFAFGDNTEEHHIEIALSSLDKEVIERKQIRALRDGIAALKPIQRRRLIKHFYEGKSSRQIAKEEGVAYSAVDKSIAAAINNLKKILN